jgi:lipid-binding SYLF domain-containing protein
MRKELAMAAIGLSLIGASMLPVLPAIAQTASGDQAAASTNGTSADRLLKGASTAVHDMQADPHFADLMSHCKGMFIIPTVVKGGLIVGGKGGQGVLVKKTADGWSQPAFLTLGTVSLGAQAGGAAGQTIMLLMTTKAMHDFTQANNFSLGANAGLTVIGYSAKGQAPVGKGDIVIWSNQSGAFAGTTVSATDITSNKQEDHNFYGDTVSTSQIIKGQVPQQPAADQFESTLSS